MSEDRLQERVGWLPSETMSKLNVCVKTALSLV